MKNKIRNIAAAGTLLLALGACSDNVVDENLPDGDVPVLIHTRVASEADNTYARSKSARLIFWIENEFHNNLVGNKGNGATYRFTELLDREIDSYSYSSHNYYTTRYTYPAENVVLHATGYAPDSVLIPTGQSQRLVRYGELTVDEKFRDGSIDLLTLEGKLGHSANDGHNFLNADRELKFKHVTAKISFHAVRSEEMYGLVGVRDLRIGIHNQNTTGSARLIVPIKLGLWAEDATGSGLAYQGDYVTYYPTETTQYNPDGTDSLRYAAAIPLDDYVNIGNLYVLSDGIEYGSEDGKFNLKSGELAGAYDSNPPVITFDLDAQVFNAAAGSGSEAFVWGAWHDQQIEPGNWTSFNTGDKFLPGYEYKIYITFNRVGIAIRAEAVPWESDELHEYPIHPSTP